MNTQTQNEELEVPSGRIYFADIITTDFGLYESLDALLLWISENPSEVAGSGKRFVRSYRNARHELSIVFACEDTDYCDCSWQLAYRKWELEVKSIKEQGGTDFPAEPDFDTTPKHESDCEEEYEVSYRYVDLGTLIK